MKGPTEQQIRAMTPDQRLNLLINARKMGDLGKEVIATLERLDLPYPSGGLSRDHPLYQEMEEIIGSPEAKAAALKAVDAGLPAMAGTDPLLQKRMGKRYTNEQRMTVAAGYITGDLMISLGYEQQKEGVNLPKGCIAKSSTTWKLRRPLK